MTARIFRDRLESVTVVVECNAAAIAYLSTESEIIGNYCKSKSSSIGVYVVSGKITVAVVGVLFGDTVKILLSERLKAVVLLDHIVPA